MATFDNTRPLVAAMARGLRPRLAGPDPRASSSEAGVEVDYDRPALTQSAAAATFLQLEADWEAAYLLTLQSAWMADNRKPNSMEASMAKAKAGRMGTDVTLRCVELAGTLGYSEVELLEKWARDSKILDIFEGTQQIQQLIVARRVLGLELRRAEVARRAGRFSPAGRGNRSLSWATQQRPGSADNPVPARQDGVSADPGARLLAAPRHGGARPSAHRRPGSVRPLGLALVERGHGA